MENSDINHWVAEAQNGSREALEDVVAYVQGYVYNLALRMFQIPSDAEDATQEILIKIITQLSQFRGESAFLTWVYRVATNAMLNMRQRSREQAQMSFDALSLRLEESLAFYEERVEETVENAELVTEVKRACLLGMLMCLNREDRIALILGELTTLSSTEAAYVLDTTPEAYRKRLSRARQTLVGFVARQCGLVNKESNCRCHKHIAGKIQTGAINPQALVYAYPASPLDEQQADLSTLQRTLTLFRTIPAYTSPAAYRDLVTTLFTAGDEDR